MILWEGENAERGGEKKNPKVQFAVILLSEASRARSELQTQ